MIHCLSGAHRIHLKKKKAQILYCCESAVIIFSQVDLVSINLCIFYPVNKLNIVREKRKKDKSAF